MSNAYYLSDDGLACETNCRYPGRWGVPKMIYPEIVQVVPREDYSVLVYFEDGKVTCYDVSSLLNRGVFKLLMDKDFFMNRCMILNDTLAWDVTGDRDVSKCIDIAPETLYLSTAVNL